MHGDQGCRGACRKIRRQDHAILVVRSCNRIEVIPVRQKRRLSIRFGIHNRTQTVSQR